MASPPVRRKVRRSRSLSDRLDEYCFASFVAGLEEDEDAEVEEEEFAAYVSEYASLRSDARSDETVVFTATESSSFWVSVANVTKSLVGIGMLTLPRAVAEAANPLMAVVGLLLCGALSALTFFFLGYCAHLTHTETLPRLWEQAVGPESAFLVEGMVFVDTGLSCVAFALLIGDYTARSVAGLCPGLPPVLHSRRTLVAAATLFILIPLCLKRHFSLLRVSSVAGLVCTLYVFFYVTLDAMTFMVTDDVEIHAASGTDVCGLLRSFGIYACAFMAHFNAPAFYSDLEGKSPRKFAELCTAAYTVAFLIYAAFGLAGYARFGPSVPGNALTGYDLDTPVLLMWLGMGLCVAASFPLVFYAHRDSSMRLLSRALGWPLDHKDHKGNHHQTVIFTVVSVVALAAAGALLEDVSFVVSLCGACSGACLAFVLPGVIMWKLSMRKQGIQLPRLAAAFVSMGVVVGFLSTLAVLKS